jgi:hypothetical protein
MSDQTPYSQYSGNPHSGPYYEQIPHKQDQVPLQPLPWQTPQQYYPSAQQPPLYPPPAYPYAPYPGYAVVTQQSEPGSGMAIAGLILGIISVVSFFIFYISIPVSIIGIVLSALGRRSISRRTMAIWGLVLSIIGLLLAIGFIVFYVVLIISVQPRTP